MDFMDIYSHSPWRGVDEDNSWGCRTNYYSLYYYYYSTTPTPTLFDLRTSNLFTLWVDYDSRHCHLFYLFIFHLILSPTSLDSGCCRSLGKEKSSFSSTLLINFIHEEDWWQTEATNWFFASFKARVELKSLKFECI